MHLAICNAGAISKQGQGVGGMKEQQGEEIVVEKRPRLSFGPSAGCADQALFQGTREWKKLRQMGKFPFTAFAYPSF